jgi:hypothetical protein
MGGKMSEYSFKNLEKVGRLGNQLFQIAWTYGQALSNNADPTIIPSWEYRKYFSVPDSLFRDASENSIDGGTEYYQELRYWSDYSSDVWNMFQPSDYARSELENYIGNINDVNNMENYGCSIHHRLGDYLKYPNHFPIPSNQYYISSIVTILESNPETVFYVFSDNIKRIRNMYRQNDFTSNLIEEGKMVFFNGTPRPVEVSERFGEPSDWLDLFAMSKCKNHIIANSTFSWWGAFLSVDGTVIYPSVWFGSDPAVSSIPWKNMIPEGWVEIDAH